MYAGFHEARLDGRGGKCVNGTMSLLTNLLVLSKVSEMYSKYWVDTGL